MAKTHIISAIALHLHPISSIMIMIFKKIEALKPKSKIDKTLPNFSEKSFPKCHFYPILEVVIKPYEMDCPNL